MGNKSSASWIQQNVASAMENAKRCYNTLVNNNSAASEEPTFNNANSNEADTGALQPFDDEINSNDGVTEETEGMHALNEADLHSLDEYDASARAASETTPKATHPQDGQMATQVDLDKALQALKHLQNGKIDQATAAIAKLRFKIPLVGKAVLNWVKEHPWETAAIVIPLIILACTPAMLGAVGFTAGGIAAGSIAAGIQAGIGSVAAGSAFATLTSAAMGGYGVAIVFGSAWALPTATLGAVAAYMHWKGNRRAIEGSDEGDKLKKD